MLELKNIGKAYGSTQILKDIDLCIMDGEIVSILGPSGCGKTTLLNLILGLTEVTEGSLQKRRAFWKKKRRKGKGDGRRRLGKRGKQDEQDQDSDF